MPVLNAPKSVDASTLQQLSTAVQIFQARYARLTNPAFYQAIQNSNNSALINEYTAIKTKADTVKNYIDRVLGGWETVKGWLGLGVLPIAGILLTTAAAAAAIATIVAVNDVIQNFIVKANARDIQIKTGKPYDVALREAQSLQNSGDGFFNFGFGDIPKYVAIGLFALLAYRMIS